MGAQEKTIPLHSEIGEAVKSLNHTFESGRTRPYSWRMHQLKQIIKMMEEREKECLAALYSDSKKTEMEAYGGEVGFVKSEAKHTMKNLKKWMQVEKHGTPLMLMPAKSVTVKEPLGVVLIIGAWNYPIHLTLGPLVPIIAAGNCAIIKPSEVSPAASAFLAKWVPQYLDPTAVRVIEGSVPETTELLRQKFDKIIYTGNGSVATVVMEAAAKHLTPVTLELGGKSPCIVDKDADLDVTARRIIWGKFYNAGQTCVAPDYVLVHKDVEEKLIQKMSDSITKMYGADPQKSPDYSRIINNRHYNRIAKLMSGGEVAFGGKTDEKDNFISPTLLRKVNLNAPLMNDEIFGPLLPILGVSSMDEAVHFVRARPKPLALYLFSKSQSSYDKIVGGTSSGGVCVNAAIMHVANPHLGFGGVGGSGMGAYHGKTGFNEFSHRKSVMTKALFIDPKQTYPPYDENTKKFMKRFL